MSDLISRADAMQVLCDQCAETFCTCPDNGCFYGAEREKINALPSAEAVRRKAKCCPIAETCMSIDCPVSSEYIGRPSAEAVQGEWIRKNYHTYICNQCGYEEAIYGNVEEYRFCSHCGARMKGGDSE